VRASAAILGGRPKEADDVKQLARQYKRVAVERLVDWMRSNNSKASVSASVALIDRGWGQPTQPHTGDDIPRSGQNPKILWIDDAEVVCDRIAKFRPLFGDLFA